MHGIPCNMIFLHFVLYFETLILQDVGFLNFIYPQGDMLLHFAIFATFEMTILPLPSLRGSIQLIFGHYTYDPSERFLLHPDKDSLSWE